MKSKIVCGLMTVGALLAFAGAASATLITKPLSSFVIFSGGGVQIGGALQTDIGGHTSITGNIGSNQNLFMQGGTPEAGFPSLLMGGAYAGGNLTFGQTLTVGSPSALQQVVVNGAATINGFDTINGTLNANTASVSGTATVTGGTTTGAGANTFALITMPTATVITAGSTPVVANGQTLAPGSYGALTTTAQNKTITLTSGTYKFSSINVLGGFTLKIDLSSGNPIYIYVVGNMTFLQNNAMLVKGAVGDFVPVKDAPNLASLIYMETNANFSMSGNNQSGVYPQNIWGGTLYASDINLLDDDSNTNGDIGIGQYMNWTGAAYAFDLFQVADHGTWTLAPFTPPFIPPTSVPEPTSLLLLGAGLVGLARYGRKHFWKK